MIVSNVSVLVVDYDRAIDFFINKLGFVLLCDVPVTEEQRWVRVAPRASELATDESANVASGAVASGAVASGAVAPASAIVLTRANKHQQQLVGKQAGDGVFLFLQSDNFWQDYQRMKTAGLEFLEEPREEAYATVVIFRDCEGNKWDLLQAKPVA